MENPKYAPAKEQPLNDSIQLAIRDEVEKRVEQRENVYWKFGGLFVAVVVLFFAVLWKVSVSEIRETVEKQLAEKEVVKARDRISAIKSEAEQMSHSLNEISASISTNQQWFVTRIGQIKQQDNVVLSDDLSKLFVIQTVTNLVDGNQIILDYDPIPHTVRVTFQQAQLYYDSKYFGQLDGKTITLNAEGIRNFSSLATNAANRLGVVYVRKSLR